MQVFDLAGRSPERPAFDHLWRPHGDKLPSRSKSLPHNSFSSHYTKFTAEKRIKRAKKQQIFRRLM
jgi:hypothetical protein